VKVSLKSASYLVTSELCFRTSHYRGKLTCRCLQRKITQSKKSRPVDEAILAEEDQDNQKSIKKKGMLRKKKSNPPSDVQASSVKALPSTNLDVQTPRKPAKGTSLT
jgi:hypothetical protein